MRRLMTMAFFASLCASGCGAPNASTQKSPAENTASPALDGAKFLLQEGPAAAQEVIAARKSAKDGDDVVIEGRIGGDTNPWVDDRAAFVIVDRSLIPCNERPGDDCKTPWDYCCDTDRLPQAKATVKFVDDQGKTLPTDARKLLNLKELQTVVVQGKAKRDEGGNLTVLATGLYLKPASAEPPGSESSK